PSRVLPGNMKDNFWEMGDTGPCGPCSEIHYDRIGGRDAAKLVNSGDPDVLEIWNHVFIQFNRESATRLVPLPAKHVDTGMGFERLTSVLQNARSNYDTDVFAPLFVAIERITHTRNSYGGKLGAADTDNSDTAYRVIADHIRTLTFAITDGAVPGNEGRGYVLRRILRRAVRYGRQCLGAKTGFLSELVPTLVEQMGPFFPELLRDPKRVAGIIKEEELSFERTLDRGIVLFDEACVRSFSKARLHPHYQTMHAVVSSSRDADGWTLAIHERDKAQAIELVKVAGIKPEWTEAHFNSPPVIEAEDVFKLYDTFGFPTDLTDLMAQERGLRADLTGFTKLMEEAKEKARSSGKFSSVSDALALTTEAVAKLRAQSIAPTDDHDKFHGREIRAKIVAIWNGGNFDDLATMSTAGMSPIGVVLDKTNFYAEMGGQQPDTGRVAVLTGGRSSDDDQAQAAGEFRVEDVRAAGGYVLHIGRVGKHQIRVGDTVVLTLDHHRRTAISANHTATHLLNLGLRAVLGSGVEQKGSLVAPDRLRFDFSHGKPVAPEELEKIEAMVAAQVRANLPVHTDVVKLDQAKTIKGVRAVFGEAYPDPVRVVSVGRPVADLLRETDEARAMVTSAEFCGGTHVSATGEIGAFVLTGEEGVAKGIRRITASGGVPAQAAIAAGQSLEQRVRAAGKLDGEDLATEVKQITLEMEQLAIPLVVKQRIRAALAGSQEKLKAAGKQASAARAGEVAGAAKAIADSPEYDQGSFIVTAIDAGSDREALNAAITTVRTRRPRHAVLLVSPDTDEGKLTIVAAVPDVLIKRGLNAGDWVRAAAAACGGRGGGKPDMAQGGGTDLTKLKDALAAATSHAFSKAPN
ncbi:MAG: alanine--tRNA ligase-related protein, partial [Phycisphaerales bacterium]